MAVESFDEETILSLDDLLERLHRHIDKIFSEIIRRSEMKEDYYAAIFRVEKPKTRQILAVLRESEGPQSFTNIQHFVGCSSSTLTNALGELVERGLVKWERGLYQAASPAWFIQKKLEQKR